MESSSQQVFALKESFLTTATKRPSFLSQKTVADTLVFEGLGVHTGVHVLMTINSAPADTGIVFIRKDLPRSRAYFSLDVAKITDCMMSTRLHNEHGDSVLTIEHLLASFAGMGITNAIVELSHPEVPIMDGSSSVFVNAFTQCGVIDQIEAPAMIRIIKPVSLQSDNSFLSITPFEGRTIHYHFDGYGRMDSLLKGREYFFDLEKDSFKKEIAHARTFGFLEDGVKLKSQGLALGASLDNTVVIHNDIVLNKEGLRSEVEFAQHKILDLIGDMATLEFVVYGHITARNTGHSFHNKFLRKLLKSTESWEYVS